MNQQIENEFRKEEIDRKFASIFTNNLLNDFIIMCKLNNISLKQKIWTYSRLENFTLSLNEITVKINIIKLFQLGEPEMIYYCLLKLTPDPMTESYHFISQEIIDWLKSKIENWLGNENINIIKNLT